MQRSFRNTILVLLVLVATVPMLLVAVPLADKIYQITRDSALRELHLTAERAVNDVRAQLDIASGRFRETGQNKDVIAAAESPFFNYRAIDIVEDFRTHSDLIEDVYLLDADGGLVDAVPENTAAIHIQSVVRAVKAAMPNPLLYKNHFLWLDVDAPDVIAEMRRNHKLPPDPQQRHLLLMAMPLFQPYYVVEKSNQIQGYLVAVVPFDHIYARGRGVMTPEQNLDISRNGVLIGGEERSADGYQLAESPLVLSAPGQADLTYAVTVSEPNSVRFASVEKTLLWLFVTVLVVAALLSAAAYALARHLGRPIQRLETMAQRYAEGDYHEVDAPKEYDEFRRVRVTLENLGQRIKQQLAELREANVQLKEADKLKDDFLANTSHELRTPLHGIIGIASSLLDGAAGELSPKVFRNVRLVEQSGRRLEQLVNDILDFSRIKNNALTLELKPVGIYGVVDIVISLLITQAERAGLQLINAVPRQLPLAYADENRLQQILHNLVGNSLKFTPDGNITVSAEQQGESLRVTVSDTGIGIPAEKISKIFEPFVQVEGALTRTRSGSGLGLSITRRLVELHGGSLEVTSTAGEGSCFSFSLPLSQDQEEYLSAVPAPLPRGDADVLRARVGGLETGDDVAQTGVSNLPQHEAHVLIVDDELINLEILTNYFFNEPYTLHRATNGAEALALIDQGMTFDLILLDVMMPNMSGYEVCRRLRENHALDHVPVIFLTARNQTRDMHHGFSLGANDYLIKPVSRIELLTRCQYHIHYARVQRELETLNTSLEESVSRRTAELERMLGLVRNHSETFKALVEISIDLQGAEELHRVVQLTLERLAGLYSEVGFGVLLHLSQNPTDLLARFHQFPPTLEQEVTARVPALVDEEWEAWLISHDILLLPLMGRKQRRLGEFLVYAASLGDVGREAVELYSRQLAAVVDNRWLTEELERLAAIDPLTNTFNRRYFERAYANLCYAFARAPDRHFSLLSIDINDLKSTNDHFGHEAGDLLIIAMIDVLNRCVRQNDIVCRVGGDEFVVLAEATSSNAVERLAERLLEAQQGAFVEFVNPDSGLAVKIIVGFSIGWASTDEVGPEQLLRLADQRMYDQKQAFHARGPLTV